MAKFSGPDARVSAVHPVATTGERTFTHEGGIGWGRDPKSELFLLAVTNMVSEPTFYESDRDTRFSDLIAKVTVDDPEWVARFVPYLRDTMQMRSASIVMAAEYVRAGGPNGRRVVAAACSRADEPAELLGYWTSRYGKRIPQPVKRGVADAAVRLYDERSALKYDGQSRSWRMADVIDLTHPKPGDDAQALLFRWLLDRRHKHNDSDLSLLPVIRADHDLLELPEDQRRAALREGRHTEAGWSWERLAGWLPGGMDAEAWEAVIPQMGYMALLRNLRNFDETGVSDATAETIAARLSDPEQVARSRQFPLRFLSAWKAAQSMRWGLALERALEHSLSNVPNLPGRTLVLVDLSGSMKDRLSARSEAQRWEAAAVFGIALARRCENVDLYAYSNDAALVEVTPSVSVLRSVPQLAQWPGSFRGTYTMGTINQTYRGHDRVVVLTDEQAHDAGQAIPNIPRMYTFNLAGYRPAHLPNGTGNSFAFGGLTDAGFRAIELLERGATTDWPF